MSVVLVIFFVVCVCLLVCVLAFANTYQRGHLFEYTPTNRGLSPVGGFVLVTYCNLY